MLTLRNIQDQIANISSILKKVKNNNNTFPLQLRNCKNRAERNKCIVFNIQLKKDACLEESLNKILTNTEQFISKKQEFHDQLRKIESNFHENKQCIEDSTLTYSDKATKLENIKQEKNEAIKKLFDENSMHFSLIKQIEEQIENRANSKSTSHSTIKSDILDNKIKLTDIKDITIPSIKGSNADLIQEVLKEIKNADSKTVDLQVSHMQGFYEELQQYISEIDCTVKKQAKNINDSYSKTLEQLKSMAPSEEGLLRALTNLKFEEKQVEQKMEYDAKKKAEMLILASKT